MTQIQFRLVAILLLLGLASAQINNALDIMSYNPTTGANSVTSVGISEDRLRWMYIREITTPTAAFQLVSVRYNPASSGNRDVVTHTTTTVAAPTVRAFSRGLTCALIVDGSALNVVKFDFSTSTATTVQNLVGTSSISDATVAYTGDLAVADDCVAIRINSVVYHANSAAPIFSNAASTTAGSGGAWAGIIYNEDFSVVVGDTGIFKYTVAASAPLRSYQAAGTFSPAL